MDFSSYRWKPISMYTFWYFRLNLANCSVDSNRTSLVREMHPTTFLRSRRNQYCLNIHRHRLISRNDQASLAWAFHSYTSVNSRREQPRPGFSNVLVFFKQSWSKSRLISHQSESISFIKVSKPFVLSRQLQTRNVRKLVIRKKMFLVLFVSLRVSFIYQT